MQGYSSEGAEEIHRSQDVGALFRRQHRTTEQIKSASSSKQNTIIQVIRPIFRLVSLVPRCCSGRGVRSMHTRGLRKRRGSIDVSRPGCRKSTQERVEEDCTAVKNSKCECQHNPPPHVHHAEISVDDINSYATPSIARRWY